MTEKNYSAVEQSVYGYLKSSSKKFIKSKAISFYNTENNYYQLFENIEKTAATLKRFGIQKGDVVVVSLPSIPEAVYLFYAVNKLGAIYCGMDCRNTEEENAKIISQINPKICFISDFHLSEFKDIDSPTIVYIYPSNSIGGFMNTANWFGDLFTGRLFLKSKKKNVYSYKEYIKKFSSDEIVNDEEVSGEDVCAYFYTSGTTYGRKCVVLTNKNVNSAIFQHANNPETPKNGGRLLNIMPLFTCYGVSLGTHLPLCIGMEIRLHPLFKDIKMKDTLLKEKPNAIITVPGHWDSFINDDFTDCDLSFLTNVVVGGDKMFPESVNKINSIFNKCGSSAYLMNGYGLTETCSTAVNPSKDTPEGSMGKAACLSKIKIVDCDTMKELHSGIPGEICIHSPSVCKGYLNDKDATDKLLKTHDDGLVWLHSGDIGYADENGYIYFCERKKRMYVRYDGTKVSPYAIEQILLKCPIVEKCMIVAQKDEEHNYGMCPVAVVVLKKDSDRNSAQKIIEKFSENNIAEYMKPREIKIVDELPKTKFNKIDYFAKNL